jgi:uncharacterized protein YhdP
MFNRSVAAAPGEYPRPHYPVENDNGTRLVIGHALRILALVIGGLALLALVAFAVLAVRLGQGPVSLSFLTPFFEAQLNALQPPLKARLGDVVLRWQDAREGISLRLLDVTVSGPDDRTVATIPELGIEVDLQSLAQRSLMIEEVTVYGLRLDVIRRADGSFGLLPRPSAGPSADPSAAPVSLTLSDLVGGATGPPAGGALSRIRVVDADVILRDAAGDEIAALTVAKSGVSRSPSALNLAVELALPQQSRPMHIAAVARPQPDGKGFDAEFRFESFTPARLAPLADRLAPLAAVAVPLDGKVNLSLAEDGTPVHARIDVTAAGGELIVSPELAQHLNAPGLEQRLPVKALVLQASLDPNMATGTVETFDLRFADGAALVLPPPVDHRYPLSQIGGRGRLKDGQIEIEAVTIDLLGVVLNGRASVVRGADRIEIAVEAVTPGMAINDLRHYWPPKLAPGGYDWTVAHLSGGRITRAELGLGLTVEDGKVTLGKLTGGARAEGVTVDYLPPLPAIREASTTLKWEPDRLVFAMTGGTANGLAVNGGTVVLKDFDKPVETLDLELDISGPLAGALDLLSRKPLEFTKPMGIDPAKSGGEVVTRVQLKLPLLRDLPFDRVDVRADAKASAARIDGVVGELGIDNGTIDLRLDRAGMDISGTLDVGGIPGRLTWRENFKVRTPFRQRIEFVTRPFAPEKLAPALDGAPWLKTYLPGGNLNGSVLVQGGHDGSEQIAVKADLTAAEVAIPPLGWRKARGTRASADLDATIDSKGLRHISRFAGASEGLDIRGSAELGADDSLQRLEVTRLAHARTDIAATASRSKDRDWRISVRGASLDLEPVMASLHTSETAPEGSGEGKNNLRIDAALNQLWLGPDRPVEAVTGEAVRDGDRWQSITLSGRVAGDKRIGVSLRPESPSLRRLAVETDDAGAALAALGLFSDMRGGQLSLNGTFDDSQDGQPLSGRLQVKNYKIVNAPLLARLLNILALAGILDALRGDGISFTTLDAPFVWKEDLLRMTDAKAHGTTLGLTASGTVETRKDLVDVQGTIVPFYIINAALGRIPLIGDLFTGGEAGGGVFAATYAVRGPLEDPQISVNPLSLLGPGVLRHIFSIFDLMFTGDASEGRPPVEVTPDPGER